MLAQGGYLAGKRTDQILPPGMAGFRDANLYPLKGPDFATAKKYAAKSGVKDGTDDRVLHLEHRCFGSSLARSFSTTSSRSA